MRSIVAGNGDASAARAVSINAQEIDAAINARVAAFDRPGAKDAVVPGALR